jgi:glucose/arabinose dehydrogenase
MRITSRGRGLLAPIVALCGSALIAACAGTSDGARERAAPAKAPSPRSAPRKATAATAATTATTAAATDAAAAATDAAAAAADDSGLPLQQVKLPPGFRITVFAKDVPDARSLALGRRGTVFVGSRRAGEVRALVDADRDGRAEKSHVVAHDLFMPCGVAVHEDGSLYVAEVNRVLRYEGVELSLASPPVPKVIAADYPSETWHGWKFIAFGPDGRLYVPVGAPCNTCERPDPYAGITSIAADGSDRRMVARGVRNTVGFDWDPDTKELWFTDNGRDELGDDVPDDELNHVTKEGEHFGFPYCHAGTVADPELGGKRKCAEFTPPVAKLGAHVAALGMRFYRGTMFPERYRKAIFVAEHGSWNRSSRAGPVGYRVVAIFHEGPVVTQTEVFAEGWLQGGKAWGRPADVLVMPDGSLLVSDDEAGVVYRITYDARG